MVLKRKIRSFIGRNKDKIVDVEISIFSVLISILSRLNYDIVKNKYFSELKEESVMRYLTAGESHGPQLNSNY